MSTALKEANGGPAAAVEAALVRGDLQHLSESERLAYYRQVCDSIGVNPLTQPFGYLNFDGKKLCLYAKRDCTDQLRALRGVSVVSLQQHEAEGVLTVTVRLKARDGREDEDVGCVVLAGLKGKDLANAKMRAVTKAKRRATLSICGLGWLDESELDTVAEARPEPPRAAPAKARPALADSGSVGGAELFERAAKRDAVLYREGKIPRNAMRVALDEFANNHGFSDDPRSWNAEQTAKALEFLRGWEQQLAALPDPPEE